jgi:SpoVK/Ycf46/Vps4 family AAA+-type ATPase
VPLPSSNKEPEEDEEDDDSEEQQPLATVATTTPTALLDARHAPPRTRLSDITGHAAVKLRLEEVLLPLVLPAALLARVYRGIRSNSSTGSSSSTGGNTALMFYGPPGCGKTQLAQALAGEAGAAFLAVAPSDVLSKFVGQSEVAVRECFTAARRAAACVPSRTAVLFWDELDALGVARGGSDGGDASSRRLLAELLLQFNRLGDTVAASSSSSDKKDHQSDAAYESQGSSSSTIVTSQSETDAADVSPPRVIVLAATNRPEDCDPALLRRFGLRLYVGYPTVRDRARLIRKHLRDMDHSLQTTDWTALAVATEGWSGSDLQHWVREACMAPVRECLQAAARQRRRSQRRATDDGMVDDEDEDDEDAHSIDSDSDDDDNGLQAARSTLMSSLETLRPVTREDLYTALDFCLGQATGPADGQALVSPPSNGRHGTTDYDSASSDHG